MTNALNDPTESNLLRRHFLKQTATLSTAALGSIIVPATAFAQKSATPRRGGKLVLGIDNASSSDRIDPAFYFEQYMYHIGRQIFNTLTELDNNGKLVGSLAESWTPAKQGAEWRFKLRSNVAFHNGKALDANDVVYSLNHHRKKDSQSAVRGYMNQVKDIKAASANEVVITLTAPNVDFPFLLGEVNFGITPKDADFNKGIGTGPFVLQSFQPGVRTVTTRNPNYWKPDSAFVDSVETVAYNDSAARVAALLSGSVHYINRITPGIVKRLESSRQIQVHRQKSSFQTTFPGLADREPFNQPDVRLALKYALDREQLLNSLVSGYGTVANDSPLFPSNPYFTTDLPSHAYDPDKAKFHWKRSGYNKEIVLSAADGATFAGAVSAAEIYQASASKAGIPFRVNRVPADGYWTEVWIKHPFCASGWTNRSTADAYLSMICASNAPWNEARWKNAKVDQLIVAGRSELNETRRKQIYHDLQVLYANESSTVIPLYIDAISASGSKLKGYVDVPGEVATRMAERIWLDV